MLVSLLTLIATPAFAEPPSIEPALVETKKAKWDPKGKAMELYLQARIQMKKEAWDEAADLYVQSAAKQAGCGKCLDELAYVLKGAHRFEDAAKVGELLATLYPEKVDGWANVLQARMEGRDWAGAVTAAENALKVEPKESWIWRSRTRAQINQGQTDEALTLLDTGEAAGVAKEDLACMRVLVLTAREEVDVAREQWDTCSKSTDADGKRLAEGWLALTEGDVEKASKALMRAGASESTRLAIAVGRYDEGKYDASLNLTTRIMEQLAEDETWALDADVAHARALAANGKPDEAIAVLAVHVLADGWEAKHPTYGPGDVLLPSKGKSWPKEQGHMALQLQIATLVGMGKPDEAKAWFDKAVAVHGKTAQLESAVLPPAAGTQE